MGVDHLSVEGIPAVRLIVLGAHNRSILVLGNGVIEHDVKQFFGILFHLLTPKAFLILKIPIGIS